MLQTSTLKLTTRITSSAASASKRSPYEYRPNMEMWPVTTTTSNATTTTTTSTTGSSSNISLAITNPTSLTLMDCFPKDTMQLLSSSPSSTNTGRRNRIGWWRYYQPIQIRTLVRLSSTFLLFLLLLLQTTISTTSSLRFMRLSLPLFLQDMSITLFVIPIYAQILQRIMKFPIMPTSWATLSSSPSSSNHTTTQIILPCIVQEPMHYIQHTKLYRNFQLVGGILQQIIPTSLAFYLLLLLSRAWLLRHGTSPTTTTMTTTTTLLIAILRFIWTKTMLDLVQFPFSFPNNKSNTVLLRSKQSSPSLTLPIRGVIVPLVYAGYLGMINYQWMRTSYLTTIAITTGTHSNLATFSLILAMSNLIYHGIYVFGYLIPVQMIQYMNIYNTCIVCRTVEL